MECLYQPLPSRLRNLFRKGGEKIVHDLDRFKPDKIPVWRRKIRHKVPLLPNKDLFAVNTCCKGKIIFLQWSITGILTIHQGRPNAQEELVSTKQTPCFLYVCMTFVLVVVVLLVFVCCLSIFVFAFVLIVFLNF